MARPATKITGRALTEVGALAKLARQADAQAAAQWAATYDAIARLAEDRELTAAAAADLLGVSEATLNRALAARRRDREQQ